MVARQVGVQGAILHRGPVGKKTAAFGEAVHRGIMVGDAVRRSVPAGFRVRSVDRRSSQADRHEERGMQPDDRSAFYAARRRLGGARTSYRRRRWLLTSLTLAAHGGTTIRGQFPQAGECSARSGAKAMILSVRLAARPPACSRRSTPAACVCWISGPLRLRCAGSSYPDLPAHETIAPALIHAAGSTSARLVVSDTPDLRAQACGEISQHE